MTCLSNAQGHELEENVSDRDSLTGSRTPISRDLA